MFGLRSFLFSSLVPLLGKHIFLLHPFANLIILQSTTQLLWALSDSTQPHVEKANELRNVLHIDTHTGVSWFLYATKVLNRLQWKMSMVHGFE